MINFCRFKDGGANDQVLLHRRCFLTSASSSTEIPGQNSILRKLPTTACWFRVKMGKDIEQLLAISKSKCPSLVEANHSTVKLNDSLHFQRILRPWRQIIQNLCRLGSLNRPLSHVHCPLRQKIEKVSIARRSSLLLQLLLRAIDTSVEENTRGAYHLSEGTG